MPEGLKPLELLSRYRFVLDAFGLKYVKTQIYTPGKKLDAKKNDNSYDAKHQGDGEANMHTGYSRGDELSPLKTGQQAISSLGTPVFSDMILHKQKTSELEGLQLLWVLIDVEQTKNIVRTKISGRNGAVKEYISDDDYVVNLKGAIVRTFSQSYPKEEMKLFLDLLKEQKSLKVVSEYLLLFGIYELVVDSYKIGQEQGRQNIQKFEIKCWSDSPLVLKKAPAP